MSGSLQNTQINRVCWQLMPGMISVLNCTRASQNLEHHVTGRKAWEDNTSKVASNLEQDIEIHTKKLSEIE